MPKGRNACDSSQGCSSLIVHGYAAKCSQMQYRVSSAAAASACVLQYRRGALPIYCSGTRRSCCDQHLRPSRRYRCAAGAATRPAL